MKRAFIFLCLLAASGAAHASSWSDLWLTRDQQGQRLLDSGKPADAGRSFEDARRRAYAEIKAGQYEDAAKRLEKFGDPQSQYNRGNALARSGKLENALAAYDQAIKQTSADSALGRDARHNRDLVAEQLKQQPPQSPSGSPSGGQSQSGKDGQSGKNEHSQNGNRGKQQQSSKQHAANGSQQQQNRRSQGSQGESAASQVERERQEAADAKRDAETAMATAKKEESAKTSGQNAKLDEHSTDQNGSKDQNATAAIHQPPSEQALALEQWLRQIPDDPAGLLRRKFLIEHLRREQESRR